MTKRRPSLKRVITVLYLEGLQCEYLFNLNLSFYYREKHFCAWFCWLLFLFLFPTHSAVKMILLKWMRGLSSAGTQPRELWYLRSYQLAPCHWHNTQRSFRYPRWHFSLFVWICIQPRPLSLTCFTVHLNYPLPARVISFPICSNVCKCESLWVEGMAGLFLVWCSWLSYKLPSMRSVCWWIWRWNSLLWICLFWLEKKAIFFVNCNISFRQRFWTSFYALFRCFLSY